MNGPDITRLHFALALGASATACLLAALGPFVARPHDDAPSPPRGASAAWSALLVAWLAAAVVHAPSRAFAPWQGWAVGALVLALASWGPLARVAASLPLGGVVGVGALRLALAGLRLVAASSGWLPQRFAYVSAACDALVALGAVGVLLAGPSRRGLVRAWSAAGLVTLGLSAWMQRAEVRPLPHSEALLDAFALPFFAVAHALVLRASLRRVSPDSARAA